MNCLVYTAAQCLRHYTTSRKVAGSEPDEINYFFSIYLILPASLGLGFSEPLTESVPETEAKILLVSRARQMRENDTINAICQPIVYKTLGP
jgi:hypothetical protein